MRVARRRGSFWTKKWDCPLGRGIGQKIGLGVPRDGYSWEGQGQVEIDLIVMTEYDSEIQVGS